VPQFLLHRQGDAVGVATEDLSKGDAASGRFRDRPDIVPVTMLDDVPLGHKVAVRDLAVGDLVIEYGVAIGVATASISAGQHVHVHNLKGQRWA